MPVTEQPIDDEAVNDELISAKKKTKKKRKDASDEDDDSIKLEDVDVDAAPITVQPAPGTFRWMNPPAVRKACPIGLEYLSVLDRVVIVKLKKLDEDVHDIWYPNNRYRVLNAVGQQIYYVCEVSSRFEKPCFCTLRSTMMHVTDRTGMEVIRVRRPGACMCCVPFTSISSQRITVETPPGTVVGRVRQSGACTVPLNVFNDDYQRALQVSGPCFLNVYAPCCCCLGGGCLCCCCKEGFSITTYDGHEIGHIKRRFQPDDGTPYVNDDGFGVTFPLNLDVRFKTILIGIALLYDYMYFCHACPKNCIHGKKKE